MPSEEQHFTFGAPAVFPQHTHPPALLAMLAEFTAAPSCGKSSRWEPASEICTKSRTVPTLGFSHRQPK